MSPEAKALFVSFHDRYEDEWVNLDGAMAAAIRKMVAYAARFALIFQCVRGVACGASLDVVDETSMAAGIVLADWFKCEADRLYAGFCESPEEVESRKLVGWIRGRGGSASVRDLTRNLRRFRNDSEAAEKALAELVEAGHGSWIPTEPTKGGGRPSRRFHLADTADADETTTGDTVAGGFGTVGTGGTPENTPGSSDDNGQSGQQDEAPKTPPPAPRTLPGHRLPDRDIHGETAAGRAQRWEQERIASESP